MRTSLIIQMYIIQMLHESRDHGRFHSFPVSDVLYVRAEWKICCIKHGEGV
jgi:hypothetical protein